MPFLLRIELPDIPGSLGVVATALGKAGADIEAIQIVEHRPDGVAIDDVLVQIPTHVLPDSLVSACQEIPGVRVLWISPYHAGASLSLDLETIESFTTQPNEALSRLVEATPMTFRTDWALLIEQGEEPVVTFATAAAPKLSDAMLAQLDWKDVSGFTGFSELPTTLVAAVACTTSDEHSYLLLTGRPGGPEFISSERARLEHMAALAASVQTPTASVLS